MNTKLIIVEGLPGFGKSTTAKLMKETLKENNIEVELFLEGDLDHPADYDGVACFDKKAFESLVAKSGMFKEIFLERVMKKGANFLLPYKKLKEEYGDEFPDELLQTIYKNDIYELPFELNRDLIVQNWREFATTALQENKTYIFECCFIQNPVTIGMIKYGVAEEKTIDYVIQLKETIEKLNPILVYVEQDNLEYSFKKAVSERPKAWSEGFVQYYTSQGYGKLNNYEGIEGTIQVLKARRELEWKIFDRLIMKKVKLNNTNYDVESYRTKIHNILNEMDG